MTAAAERATPILGSFWFFREIDLTAELATRPPLDFFADSGAFSAHTTGAVIDVDEYAAWLAAHASVINCAAALDVIDDYMATARNVDRLIERVGDAVTVVPTFHVGSPWPELQRLCRDHRYVALGGAVRYARRHKAMMRWLITAHRIAAEHDTRLHGFGLTRPPFPLAFPWYSVDSAYWRSASRTGTLSLWTGRALTTFRVGAPDAVRHADLIRSYGGNPAHVAAHGFGLTRVVGERGGADQRWMERASVATFRRYEAHIRNVRGPLDPPTNTRTTGTGPKVYLAAGDIAQLDSILAHDRTEVTS